MLKHFAGSLMCQKVKILREQTIQNSRDAIVRSHGKSFIVKSRFIQYWIGLGYWMTEFNQTSAIVLLFSIKMHFH